MIWPFVSRRAFDRAIDASMAANQRALLAEARASAIETRFDALMDRFTALRVAGAVAEPPPVVPTRIGPAPHADELKALIGDVCGSDLRKRRMMLRQLDADRADGTSDDDIRAAIRAGVQSDGVPA